MWTWITIGTGADPDDVTDVFAKMQRFVDDDGPEETGVTVTIFNAASAKMHRDAFFLPFTPVGHCYTTGPNRNGSVQRKTTFYLARGKDGKIVKKLVSIHPVESTKSKHRSR